MSPAYWRAARIAAVALVLFLLVAPLDTPVDRGKPVVGVILSGDVPEAHGNATIELTVQLPEQERVVNVPLRLNQPYLPRKRIHVQRMTNRLSGVESWRFVDYLPDQGVEDAYSVNPDG